MEKIIVYSFSFIMEGIILWMYASTVFTPKRKGKTIIATICVLYFGLFLASMLEIVWLNIPLYFLSNFVVLFLMYDSKWYAALFHCSVIVAIMSMSELTAYGIVPPTFIRNNGAFYDLMTFAILNKLIFFTVTYTLARVLRSQKKEHTNESKMSLLLLFIPLASTFVLLTIVDIGGTFPISTFQDKVITLSAILLLIANILVFIVNQYTQRQNEEMMEMQLLLQRESDTVDYYKMLLTHDENPNILIHDIKKHLQSIDLLNQQHDYDKIDSYIRQLLSSSDLQQSKRICDRDILNALLIRYQRQCMEMQISFHADIRKSSTDFINDTDITSLFCNLLDNAIEAAQDVPDAFVEIYTAKKEHTPYVVFSVINSCKMNPFIGPHNRITTSKSDKSRHGFGLKSIKKAVNHYQGDLQQYFDEESKTFHTIITLQEPETQPAPDPRGL